MFPVRLVRQLVVVVAALAMLSGEGVRAQSAAPLVIKLSIHDTIQPITADYLKRGLDEAAARHAEAVVVSLGLRADC